MLWRKIKQSHRIESDGRWEGRLIQTEWAEKSCLMKSVQSYEEPRPRNQQVQRPWGRMCIVCIWNSQCSWSRVRKRLNAMRWRQRGRWDPVMSVHFSRSVVSDSLQPHEPHYARPSTASPTPRVHSNSCPLSRWCHPTILSSVVPFSSYPQSFPASGSFPIIQLFTSGGQSIGVSALASVLPMNIQD